MEGIPKKEISSRKREQIEVALDGQELPIQKILHQLTSTIENGEYGTILGLDASARIPTLILGGVIKRRYEDLDYDSPHIRFVAGMRGSEVSKVRAENKRRELDTYIKSLINEEILQKDKKILIVEDTAIFGESINFLANALENNGLNYEVAIVAGGETSDPTIWSEKLGVNTAVGSEYEASIFGKKDLAGVTKKHSELFAHRYNSKDDNTALQLTRQNISVLIDKIYTAYLLNEVK